MEGILPNLNPSTPKPLSLRAESPAKPKLSWKDRDLELQLLGAVKAEGAAFWSLGFWGSSVWILGVWGLGFWVLGVWGFGGFGAWGLGVRASLRLEGQSRGLWEVRFLLCMFEAGRGGTPLKG